MRRNKVRISICLFVLCGICIGGLLNRGKLNCKDESKECVEYIHATYKYNVDDMARVVADADYVFVAKVNKKVGTVNKNTVKIEDTWISNPYTKYKLSVVKNIKGNLDTKKNINILKAGGKSKKSGITYIYDRDKLPSVGKYYIFMAYIQKDGSLLVSGANSTISTNKKFSCDVNYKKVVDASKRKSYINRKRFKVKSNKIY